MFAYFWLPLGTPKIIKNRQKSVSGALLCPILCFACTFNWFWLILGAFGGSKSRFFHGSGDEICILAKNELLQSWDRFWAHFNSFLGPWGNLKWRKIASRRGSKKTSSFESLFLATLADFRRSGGSFNSVHFVPFPLHFRSWGLLFLLGGHFCLF